MGMGGTFKEVVRPSRLVATESYDDHWTGGETLVTTELVETRGKTSVSTTVRYATAKHGTPPSRWARRKGWRRATFRLDELLTA